MSGCRNAHAPPIHDAILFSWVAHAPVAARPTIHDCPSIGVAGGVDRIASTAVPCTMPNTAASTRSLTVFAVSIRSWSTSGFV